MDCREAQERLDARLDAGDAASVSGDGGRDDALAAHLAQCDACRALEAQLLRLGATLSAARAANDELFAAAATSRSVPRGRPARQVRASRRWWWSAGGLAAAACLTLAVIRPWSPRTTTRQLAETATMQTPVPPDDAAGPADESGAAAAPAPALVRLTGESRERQIAIEKDTGVPRVRLVQVYALAPRKPAATDDAEPQT